MEEFKNNLLKQKERYSNPSHRQYNYTKNDLFYVEVAKGERVIGAKDFMLVFFITCFLPFVRPSIAQIKEGEMKKARKNKKFLIDEIEPGFSGNYTEEIDFLS